MSKPRLVFLSSCAAPHMVKLCGALQRYYDAEFWFYEHVTHERQDFWRIELGAKCRVVAPVLHTRSKGILASRYVAPLLTRDLKRFDPDIIIIGGLSVPANYQAYRWARARQKKTVLFTERSRDASGNLRKWGPIWMTMHHLYRDIDLVVTSDEDIVPQFRDELRFGPKVVAGRYAADLDAYFTHALRTQKHGYTYLFANRLTDTYDPLAAIDIFATLLRDHPGSRLLMNAAGELAEASRRLIVERGLTDTVEFLTDIPSWDELHEVYRRSDVLLFPAAFSNGNFTILEAMASGMGIVISNRVLGIGNLIEDGVNGFRCEPTREAFVERVERYIDSPQLFATHGSLNRVIARPLSVVGTADLLASLLRERLGL